ncbi:L,D-transpeptidase family protein [Effusibacillus consociatus]|uniref:L,D-transpeptidase family protein n=2 Tax=Effusibacillus consociatus TaxID=1117041 RepID=A0ABV9PX60_9BACL
MNTNRLILAGFLLCLLGLTIPHAQKEVFNSSPVPTGEVALQIDPLRNQLTLLIDGVAYKKYPIALGKPETPTPVGEWKVINKYKNWGAGFGTRWIGLDVPWGVYGIHGTNKPHSIGSDASHGCVRMLNRHVEQLYEWVKIGTPVSIVGHPLREPSLEPRRLAAGDSGSDVQLIQSRLRSGGFYNGECDGRFRLSTEQALKAFEKANRLPVDGVMSLHDYRAMGLME